MQLLGEGLRDDAARNTCAMLLAEVQRLELVVASTLSQGRPVTIEPVAATIDDVVGEVLDIVAPQFEHRGITITARYAGQRVIQLDPDRMKQVIFNVLSNAADELPGGGEVLVATSTEAEHLQLCIADSGPGWPDDMIATLFAQPRGSAKPNGLGLGLVISREIVELHGGTMSAGVSAELGGAQLTILLPIDEGQVLAGVATR